MNKLFFNYFKPKDECAVFGVYNNKDDISALNEAIKKCQKIFG